MKADQIVLDVRTPARPSVTTRTSHSAADDSSNVGYPVENIRVDNLTDIFVLQPPSPVAARKTPVRSKQKAPSHDSVQ